MHTTRYTLDTHHSATQSRCDLNRPPEQPDMMCSIFISNMIYSLIDPYSKDVDLYSTDIDPYSKDVDLYSTDIDLYSTDIDPYSKVIEQYSK